MPIARRIKAVAPIGLAYFVATLTSLCFTRFGPQVVFLWSATAVMTTNLNSHSRKTWLDRSVACVVGAAAASAIALPETYALPVFVFANIFEGLLASFLLSRWRKKSGSLLGSLPWLASYVVPVGLVAPAIIALLLIPLVGLADPQFVPTLVQIVAGHALGNVIFVPLVHLVLKDGPIALWRDTASTHGREAATFLGLVAAVTAAVFSQNQLPLLFLPVLPVILVAFRLGYGPSAIAVAIVALIGTALTLSGEGPVTLINAPVSAQLLFIQVFLASILMTALPIAAELESRARLNRQLRESETRYRMIAEHSSDVILDLQIDGTIRYASPSSCQIGYEPAQLIGRNCAMLIAPEHLESATSAHLRSLEMGGNTNRFEYLALTASGEKLWHETHARVIIDKDGKPDGILSIVRNIHAQKINEQRLSEAALVDPLTGLSNRLAYREEIERRIDSGQTGACVAMLDIDHFKRVNDTFGHAAGDVVLRGFADVARRAIRDGDLVARIGGEEFAFYFPGTGLSEALAICDRLRSELGATIFRAGKSAINVTVSGGVAAVGADGIDEALRIADMALYRAKQAGRNQLTLAA